VICFERNQFQIGRIRGIAQKLSHMIDGALRRLGSTGQAAHAIRDAKKTQGFIAHNAIFVLAADPANVSK
jgi:hypothetical protein